MLANHGHSRSTFWSRPQAGDEMPIEPCEAGKGHFQLARCSGKRRSLTSARGRCEVDLRTETLGRSSSQKLGCTALRSAGEPWSRALTTRRRGSETDRCDAIKQSQRHGRMSAESIDASGQVTETCHSSCNAAVKLKLSWKPSC